MDPIVAAWMLDTERSDWCSHEQRVRDEMERRIRRHLLKCQHEAHGEVHDPGPDDPPPAPRVYDSFREACAVQAPNAPRRPRARRVSKPDVGVDDLSDAEIERRFLAAKQDLRQARVTASG